MRTKCWDGLGLGSGSAVWSLRCFSRPPVVEAYFHTRMVFGSVGVDIVLGCIVSVVFASE